MEDRLTSQLYQRIDAIAPGASGSLEQIGALPPDVARRLLTEIVSHACQGTNDLPIRAGRKAIARIPGDWLEVNLPIVVQERLNLDDDWEFRRLLELLQLVRPSMMRRYLHPGLSSTNVDVREAAQAFDSGRYGPVP